MSAQNTVAPLQPVLLAVASSGTRVLLELPPQIAAIFERDGQSSDYNDYSAHEERNKQFTVTSERRCHGCPYTLSISRRKGAGSHDSHEVAKIDLDRNYIFDANRSEVLYPKLGPIIPGSIVVLNLNTGHSQEIAVPVTRQVLVDQIHDGTAHVVGYVGLGSCEPDSSEEAATQAMLPRNVALRRQILTKRVCFARLP